MAEKIHETIDWIRANPGLRPSLETLAGRSGYCPFYFQKLFKKVVGESPSELLARTRMMRAARLLRHEPSPARISQLLGFGSSSDFSRAFKRFYGICPKDVARGETINLGGWQPKRGFGSGRPDCIRKLEIRQVPALEVAYLRVFGSLTRPEAVKAALVRAFGQMRMPLLGLCHDDLALSPPERVSFEVGVLCEPSEPVPAGFYRLRLPPSAYLVMAFEGDLEAEEEAWSYANRVWLPRSGYLPSVLPSFEVFRDENSLCDWDHLRLSLYLPLGEP